MMGKAVSSKTLDCVQLGPKVESNVKSLSGSPWDFAGLGFSTEIVLAV